MAKLYFMKHYDTIGAESTPSFGFRLPPEVTKQLGQAVSYERIPPTVLIDAAFTDVNDVPDDEIHAWRYHRDNGLFIRQHMLEQYPAIFERAKALLIHPRDIAVSAISHQLIIKHNTGRISPNVISLESRRRQR